MSGFQEILYETRDCVGIITVNRPKVLNAINYRMRDELGELFAEIKDDPKIRAVIITGKGDKAFMSGADIPELSQECPASERKEIMMRTHKVFRAIETLGKPVIAAINGMALGAGLELALACTLRLAGNSARFGLPEIKLGLIPGYGGTQRLPRLVGKARALEMLLTGKMINAEDALRIGLVNRVVKAPELMPSALELARTLAEMPAQAVKFILEAVEQGMTLPLDQALELEAELITKAFCTEDALEGLKAFMEKRKPVFKGK